MSKHFRAWKIDQSQLLPASIEGYVPTAHLSRLIVSLVREILDLSEIMASYTSRLGKPPLAEPEAKAQRNFTDPDSRILKTKDGSSRATTRR